MAPTTLAPNPKQFYGDKKPPLDELPLSAMIFASLAHLDGDNKYGFRNWRDSPVEARTYIKGAIRHLRLFEEGEDFTRDSVVHNLGAVIAGCAILIDAQVNGTLIDNRRKSPAVCDLLHAAEENVAHLNALQRLRDDKKAGKLDDLDGAIEALNESFRASHLPSAVFARVLSEEEKEAFAKLVPVPGPIIVLEEGPIVSDIDPRYLGPTEEQKRAFASEALDTYSQLLEDYANAPKGKSRIARRKIAERLRAARDVILNMANGAFPHGL